MKLRVKSVWSGTYHGVAFEIVNWKFDSEMHDFPSGNWNIYLYLLESKCVDFTKLWLEPKYFRFTPTSPERLSYDYCASPLGEVNFHGGITFYSKETVDERDRVIKIGCDFMHYGDESRHWSQDELADHAELAIVSLYNLGLLKPEEVNVAVKPA